MKTIKVMLGLSTLLLGGCIAVPVGPGYYPGPQAQGYYPPPANYGPPAYYAPPVYYGPSFGIGFYGGRGRGWR